MPRKIRVQYPGAIYHVMSRGDRRENIFLDDVDRPIVSCQTIRNTNNAI
jgi:putative transposase